ncbi:sugar phosphate permease [Pseudomonas laurylsulfatiphila]
MLWYITLANVFVYLLRYGVLDWAPTYLKEAKGFTVDHFGWDSGFVLLAGACLLAMAFLAPTLRHNKSPVRAAKHSLDRPLIYSA